MSTCFFTRVYRVLPDSILDLCAPLCSKRGEVGLTLTGGFENISEVA